MSKATPEYHCLINAWKAYEAELRRWLITRLGNSSDAEDVLQQVFEKAMLQREQFCQLENVRAWLFRVARNTLIDRYRLSHDTIEWADHIALESSEADAVVSLSECLPRVLSELSPEDREVITRCDIEGMSQQAFATMHQISLPAVKSRIQRARRRLRKTLEKNCQVRFSDAGHVCCFVPRPPL